MITSLIINDCYTCSYCGPARLDQTFEFACLLRVHAHKYGQRANSPFSKLLMCKHTAIHCSDLVAWSMCSQLHCFSSKWPHGMSTFAAIGPVCMLNEASCTLN